jgi:hypothetical protein
MIINMQYAFKLIKESMQSVKEQIKFYVKKKLKP